MNLLTEEQQPEMVDGVPLFEWNIVNPIIDIDNIQLDNSAHAQQQIHHHDDEYIHNVETEQEEAIDNNINDPTTDDDELDDECDLFNNSNDSVTANTRQFFCKAETQLKAELQQMSQDTHQGEYTDSVVDRGNAIKNNTIAVNDDGLIAPITVNNTTQYMDESTNKQAVTELEETPQEVIGIHGSERRGRGEGVTRFVPNHRGKTYFDHKRSHKQLLQKQQLMRKKRHILLTMLKEKVSRTKSYDFFQIAVNSIFLSAQMSTR